MRFKAKMRQLAPDWADQIWAAAKAKNRGEGVAWLLPLAAMALTGCRPVSLERGIQFAVKQVQGQIYVEATVPGAKILTNLDGTPKRGQREVQISWHMAIGPDVEHQTHRPRELAAITRALLEAPGRCITVQYDAEAISTRLRELSRELWPRRQYHVSAVCYRELLASESKAAGISPSDLAAAMGHLSSESQGRYAGARRRKGAAKPAKRTFTAAVAPTKVRNDRSPMDRFKRSSALRKKGAKT